MQTITVARLHDGSAEPVIVAGEHRTCRWEAVAVVDKHQVPPTGFQGTVRNSDIVFRHGIIFVSQTGCSSQCAVQTVLPPFESNKGRFPDR